MCYALLDYYPSSPLTACVSYPSEKSIKNIFGINHFPTKIEMEQFWQSEDNIKIYQHETLYGNYDALCVYQNRIPPVRNLDQIHLFINCEAGHYCCWYFRLKDLMTANQALIANEMTVKRVSNSKEASHALCKFNVLYVEYVGQYEFTLYFIFNALTSKGSS